MRNRSGSVLYTHRDMVIHVHLHTYNANLTSSCSLIVTFCFTNLYKTNSKRSDRFVCVCTNDLPIYCKMCVFIKSKGIVNKLIYLFSNICLDVLTIILFNYRLQCNRCLKLFRLHATVFVFRRNLKLTYQSHTCKARTHRVLVCISVGTLLFLLSSSAIPSPMIINGFKLTLPNEMWFN